MIESIPYVLTGIGIMVSILYYTSVLRNANKTRELQLKAQEQSLETRQAQFYLALFETRRSPEHQKRFYRMAFIDSWENYEDYSNKYGPDNNIDLYTDHGSLWQFYEGIGFLLKKKIIDLTYFDEMLIDSIITIWEKYEPILRETRRRSARPNLWINFEYLYSEINEKHSEQNP